jgi:SAM-dependent methyltransferase
MEVMNFLRQVFFNWKYLGKPPWDTGISPPELMAFIETHSPGRALDLGSGTGTNAITLARHGWEVIGVDFARRGIQIARKKARAAGVAVDFHVADVTRLDFLEGTFDLILDIGCFHGLNDEGQRIYVENLKRLLAPEGTFLMYGFFSPPDANGAGLIADDLNTFKPAGFELLERSDGTDRGKRPSAWVKYRRNVQIQEEIG